MSRRFYLPLVALLAGVLFCTGCLSDHHYREQSRLRHVLLEMYEDQLLDNLVRVREYRPIIQLTYQNMTGEITDKVSASGSGGQTDAAGAITNMFSYMAGMDRTSKLSVTANPVLDGGKLVKVESSIFDGKETAKFAHAPSIYQRYIDFVYGKKFDNGSSTNGANVNFQANEQMHFQDAIEQFVVPIEEPTVFESPTDASKGSEYVDLGTAPDNRRIYFPKLVRTYYDPEQFVTKQLTLTGRNGEQLTISGRPHVVTRRPNPQCGNCTDSQESRNSKYVWYWVPVEAKSDYLALALQTSAGFGGASDIGGNSIINELTLTRLRD